MSYAPLHVHTDASPDGAGTVQSLVTEASRLGFKHLAMTDHGTLANAVAFWSACKDSDITPILGMEGYLLYGGKRHHITLLSLNEAGFNNLIQLDTDSHAHAFAGGFPLITMENLSRLNQGIVALTGCASSATYLENVEEAEQYAGDLVDIFTRDRVFAEVMFLGSHNTYTRPLAFNKRFDIDFVITNDTHYPCRHQFHAHQAITKARKGYTYDSQHLWLKSAAEITYEGLKCVPGATIELGLANTLDVAAMVEPWDMRAEPSLPSRMDVEDILRYTLTEAFKKDVAVKGERSVRRARLQAEWEVLKSRKFLDYIYILWDIVSWSKGRGIYVGPGRGSGGGSYTLYLLGITGVDPIEYGLIFERFINPSRSDYPDVDVDFETDRRQEVMNYASEKWGTVPIATYSCYSHKSAIHDIARVLSIPKDLETPAADSSADSEAFEEFINDKPDALATYNTMLGQIRHRGKHAAGVIIANRPVPIERSGDELVAAWAEGMNTKDLSKVGIVKYDILGLTALSQLKRMKELSGVSFPDEDYSDDSVFNLFNAGDVAGIFQWSGSDGIRELTKRIAPKNFFDLTTCNALYRPGALDAGTAENYPEYMKKPRLLEPRIDKILEKTYGVICYQEQVMEIVATVMGGDLGQADLARRLISKSDIGNPKWEADIAKLNISFTEEGERNGFDGRLLDLLWNEVYTHSRYSYNLSHATAYTMISYQMAWYKVYARPEFTAAVLQYDKANAQTYMLDAIENGVAIAMPHVNSSTREYNLKRTPFGDVIYIPLSDISYLGQKAVDFILEERETNGPFVSYANFDNRIPKKVCNNRARQMLERIGAFAGLAGTPRDAIRDYETIPIKDVYENQLEVLGYVVPTPELYRKIKSLAKKPAPKGKTRFAGFIQSLKKKKSLHGEYVVYNLSPEGSFWVRGEANPKLKPGVFVSGTKNKFGSSTDVKRYRFSGE